MFKTRLELTSSDGLLMVAQPLSLQLVPLMTNEAALSLVNKDSDDIHCLRSGFHNLSTSLITTLGW